MTTSFLGRFLDLGLLPGVDDVNFGKLDTAATHLANILKSDADALRRYAYVLLDADLPDSDPILDAIEEVVKEEWRTLRSHVERPVQLLRAVLGQSLVRAATEADFSAEAILWLTANSVLPYSNLGPERQLIVDLFQAFGLKAEEDALSDWNLSVGSKTSRFKLPQKPTFNVESASLNEKALATHLKAAAGPNDAQGQATGPSPNPYWPQQNPQYWVTEFGDRAASGITEVFDSAIVSMAGNVQKTLTQMPAYLDGVAGALSESVQAMQTEASQSLTGSQTRLKLLWWKEALYSPSERTGYRRIENPVAVIFILASDFHQLLPETYPHSAEYFLREVVYDVLHKYDEQRWSLSEFSSELVKTEGVVKQLAGLTKGASGRIPLLVFLGEIARGKAESKEIFHRVGISEDVRLSADDFAVWILRELQASHLAEEEGEED